MRVESVKRWPKIKKKILEKINTYAYCIYKG